VRSTRRRSGPTRSISRARAGSAARRWATVAIEAERAVVGRRGGAGGLRLGLDRQQAQLGGDAAVGREAADPAVGGQHAVTGDHDRERVAAERLTDRARGAGGAQPRGHLAVRGGHAGRDRASDLVHPPVKVGDGVHVERHGRQVAGVAAQERRDGVERALHVGRRRGLARPREALLQAGAGGDLLALGKLDADHTAAAPGDREAADRGVEQRVSESFHAGNSVAPPPGIDLAEVAVGVAEI